ncbi:hypothetical protein HN51_010569 [Arachis hypogaea]|uniref:uncharacterized protein At4g19900 n=1 Tax=Arachis hypogaea TaxID=3818 RepID=UPI000DEC50D7|nr:uncharacterized protein At4g19900 [Arachis hypogaea]
MFRTLRSRLRSQRRPRYGLLLCALVSTLFLFSFHHTPQTNNPHHHRHHHHRHHHHRRFLRRIHPFHHLVNYDTILSDSVVDAASSSEDAIDALDIVDEQSTLGDTSDDDDTADAGEEPSLIQLNVSGYFFYHVGGAIRKAFTKSSPGDREDGSRQVGIFLGSPVMGNEDRSKATFGSDDIPVDERVRRKVVEVKGVEDALLLKLGRKDSPLREGWGDWFDKKGDFLRKDKMLRSNLEGLNPLHNPFLQDPDGVGVTGLTKGDKILHKALLNELKRQPFRGEKLPGSSQHD